MTEARHYEVLVLRRSGWTVHAALPDRQTAVDMATKLSTVEGFASVKIVHSRFDPETGVFEEHDIQFLSRSGGRVPDADRQCVAVEDDADGDATIGCNRAEDLYTLSARRQIGKVLNKSLETWVITPSELLHNYNHYRRLEDAGTLLQGAVQQAAIARPRARSVSATAVVKQIYEAIDAAARRLRTDCHAVPAPRNGREYRTDLEATAHERARRTMIDLAERLSGCRTWSEKIVRLLAVVPAGAGLEDLAAVDRILSELTWFRTGLSAMLAALHGDSGDHELTSADLARRQPIEQVIDLFDLLLGMPSQNDSVVGETAGRWLAWMRDGLLPETRIELLARLATEIEGQRSLTGFQGHDAESFQREAKAIAEISERLLHLNNSVAVLPSQRAFTRTNQRLADALDRTEARVTVALSERSALLLRPEALGVQLAAAPSLPASITLLVDLGRCVTGELNRRRIGKHLLARLSGELGQSRLIDVAGSEAIGHMKLLATWQQDVEATEYPTDSKTLVTEAIDRLCVRLMDRLQLLKSLATRKPDPVDQALALIDLASSRVITRGAAMTAVRRRVVACVQAVGGPEAFIAVLRSRDVLSKRLSGVQMFIGGLDEQTEA